jgi:hypothetical protein
MATHKKKIQEVEVDIEALVGHAERLSLCLAMEG